MTHPYKLFALNTMIPCLCYNCSYIHYLSLHSVELRDIFHVLFYSHSAICNISISVKNSSFALIFFKHAWHANAGVDKTWSGSSSHISMHLLQKFSNTSGNNKVSLCTYISWYFPRLFSFSLAIGFLGFRCQHLKCLLYLNYCKIVFNREIMFSIGKSVSTIHIVVKINSLVLCKTYSRVYHSI